MPSQHGKLPFLQVAKTYPAAIKVDVGAGIQYFTTIGGFMIPNMPSYSFGIQTVAGLAVGAFITLAIGALNQYTVIKKVFVTLDSNALIGIAENVTDKLQVRALGSGFNVIDFGENGGGDFCIANLDELRLYNRDAAAINVHAAAFGYQVPYQT